MRPSQDKTKGKSAAKEMYWKMWTKAHCLHRALHPPRAEGRTVLWFNSCTVPYGQHHLTCWPKTSAGREVPGGMVTPLSSHQHCPHEPAVKPAAPGTATIFRAK